MRKKARKSCIDWKRLAVTTDAQIDGSDVPELDKDFFRHAEVRMPKAKQMVSLCLNSDVMAWFKR